MSTYESPEVKDYGTLLDLTLAGTLPNADSPAGNPDSAFPVAS